MRSFGLRVVGFVLAAFALLVGGELALRALPILDGVQRQPPSADLPHARLQPNVRLQYSQGWDLREVSGGRTNSDGYVAPYDYSPDKPGIALMGDSFAEGMSLPFERSLSGALNRHLGQSGRIYNFGMSGASLAHHLGVARKVGNKYPLHAALVIVSPNDYVEALYPDGGMYHWAPTGGTDLIEFQPSEPPGALRLVLREIAWLRYLRHHLKVSVRRLFDLQSVEAMESGRCDPAGKDDLARAQGWLAELPKALNLPPERIVLLFDVDRDAIYRRIDLPRQKSSTCKSVDLQFREHLKSQADKAGFRTFDSGPLFEGDYVKHRSQLDYSPLDRHWNPRAVDLLAGGLAPLIQQALARQP